MVSSVRGSPDLPPLKTRRVYPHLAFIRRTAIVPASGTDRLSVTEQRGRVYSLRDDPECREADLFLDVAELVGRLTEQTGKQPDDKLVVTGLSSIAFHPKFAENQQRFISYAVGYEAWWAKPRLENGARVVRLTVSLDDPLRCDPDSEVVLLTWQLGGHQGGCVAFGPDGYLYGSAGDAGEPVPPDGYRTGQDVSDLLASVMRIDVDQTDGDRPYAIPPDNPLLAYPGARGEIYAYGMRNPWKFSFDRKTGAMWVGDVGWEMWEWIYKVNPGDNFGWSVTDGNHPLHVDWPRGPTPIVPPTVELSHSAAARITGSYVYRGSRFPELEAQYVAGDWETRRIWAVDAERPDAAAVRDLVDPTLRIVSFGEKADGELLVLDYDNGTIHELARNDAVADTAPFPTTLWRTAIASAAADRPTCCSTGSSPWPRCRPSASSRGRAALASRTRRSSPPVIPTARRCSTGCRPAAAAAVQVDAGPGTEGPSRQGQRRGRRVGRRAACRRLAASPRSSVGRSYSSASSGLRRKSTRSTSRGSRSSLMPEQQFRDLTAEQAADLLAYLQALR